MSSDAFMAKLSLARDATRSLATATTEQKNRALLAIADAIMAALPQIIAANQRDLEQGRAQQLAAGLLNRLLLTEDRLRGLAEAVRAVARLADPVGQIVRGSTLANGLQLSQLRVPIGVLGVIYEARPNVTVDIAALAIKSGNAVVLRGGTAAQHSNRVLVELIQHAVTQSGLVGDAVQSIDEFGREGAARLMRARGYIDVLIPRGSSQLISRVVHESTVPVIETGAGLVHVFVDASADEQQAVEIVTNAKTHRPSVCNAAETLLVHRAAAARLLPAITQSLRAADVVLYGDEQARQFDAELHEARPEVWSTEHLALEMGVKVVDSIDAALEHIARYSSHHTEAIITEDYVSAQRFIAEVDSAVVMVNASTRFTDGGEFGFGAEVGIATQKLHARGPMGLAELTSTKWIVRGNGQIR